MNDNPGVHGRQGVKAARRFLASAGSGRSGSASFQKTRKPCVSESLAPHLGHFITLLLLLRCAKNINAAYQSQIILPHFPGTSQEAIIHFGR